MYVIILYNFLSTQNIKTARHRLTMKKNMSRTLEDSIPDGSLFLNVFNKSAWAQVLKEEKETGGVKKQVWFGLTG